MSNSNRNNRNRWDDDRNYDDFRNNEKRNWERDSRRNTSMHQGSWNERGGSQDENRGLGDTSQGSANYGHADDNRGARYYGTGNYGGYFGGESNQRNSEGRRNEDRRGFENRRDNETNDNRRPNDVSSYNTGNYGRGPRYGNSNVHGNTRGGGSSYGSNYGSESGYGRDFDSSGSGYSRRDENRGSRYGSEERTGNWDNDRDWWDRTADEVSSWFGDDEAGRRREMDKLYGAHSGKGPKGFTRSDEKIKNDIEEKLYHDSFIDATEIEVTVKDGEVTLSGTVDNKQTKRRAEDCADRISGVKDVSNHLKTSRSTASNYSSEIGSLNKDKSYGSLSDSDKSLDQSKDLNRTGNK